MKGENGDAPPPASASRMSIRTEPLTDPVRDHAAPHLPSSGGTAGPNTPSLLSFAWVGAAEAIARGVTLSVYPLVLYRATGSVIQVSQVYLLVGCMSLATVLAVPLLTRVVPRRWAHTLAVALYLLSAALGIAGGAATAFALLSAAMATSIGFVCYSANMLDYVDRNELSRLETLRLFAAGFGWTVGPFAGVWLLSFWHGAPFVVVALAAGAMGLLIWRTGMGPVSLRAAPVRVSPNPLRYLPRFLAQPRLVAGWYLAVVRGCGWSVYLVYVGIFAVQAGLPDTVGGLAASIASAGLFLTPLMLRWMRRHTVRFAVRLGFGVSGLCFVAAMLTAAWPAPAIGWLVLGAFFLVLLDLCGGLPFLMAVRPAERTEMSAVYSTFRDIAAVATPGLVWVVLQVAPLPVVFGVAGLLLLSAWWVSGFVHPNLGVPASQRQRPHRPMIR
jgi:ACDE family multidrug resistance protein